MLRSSMARAYSTESQAHSHFDAKGTRSTAATAASTAASAHAPLRAPTHGYTNTSGPPATSPPWWHGPCPTVPPTPMRIDDEHDVANGPTTGEPQTMAELLAES